MKGDGVRGGWEQEKVRENGNRGMGNKNQERIEGIHEVLIWQYIADTNCDRISEK